jgi:hypothetical protein
MLIPSNATNHNLQILLMRSKLSLCWLLEWYYATGTELDLMNWEQNFRGGCWNRRWIHKSHFPLRICANRALHAPHSPACVFFSSLQCRRLFENSCTVLDLIIESKLQAMRSHQFWYVLPTAHYNRKVQQC